MRVIWKTGASQFWIAAPHVPYFSILRNPLSATAIFAIAVFCLSSAGCKTAISEKPVGATIEIHPPLGLPPVPIPADNLPTADTIALGRRLFYDTSLSRDNTLACASCHKPEDDFSDGAKISKGVGGVLGIRNAPTILNAAYQPLQFWDGRALTLEQQAASPIADPLEMNQPHEIFLSKLAKDPTYKTLFGKSFGSPDVTLGRVEKAIASFERTVLSGNSAFDRYQYRGDHSALTPAQVRGLALFINPQKGNCASCHTLNPQYALFTDGKFHNTGIGVGDEGAFGDVGRYHETKVETDKAAFKTPTLRNVANTAPYMHDGSLQTLRQVVDFYAGGGNSNPYLDKEMKTIHLDGQERSDLVEFLKSLTGEIPPNVGPPGKQ